MNVKHEFSQYIAEFIGAFFLIFFGCGSMVLAETSTAYNGSLVPLIWGGVVSAMIYAVGHISGAHFNPAVTIAFWCIKRFPLKRVLGYVVAQILGAICASFVFSLIWKMDHSFGQTTLSTSVGVGFLVEFIMSFALMFVITSVATDSRAVGESAGIAIGLTVGLCAFVGGPLTKASMNPARSIGPAIMTGEFDVLWLYILAPILGALVGAKTYEWIRCQKDNAEDNHGCC